MIKIQEHLDRTDADQFLDQLSEEHWESLNEKLAHGRGYKKSSLIEKCEKYKLETKNKGYIDKYAHGDSVESKRHELFFNFLVDSDAKELIRIIKARPTEFVAIKRDIYKILKETDIFTTKGIEYSQTPFGVLLSDTIFNYRNFRTSDFCKNLFTKIGFNSATCPCCNDNELKIVPVNKSSPKAVKLKAYLDLDHFYPKSQHPFFALSFFNLIPTCNDCNSRDKGDKSFTIETHIHPYYESFDDFYRFKISLKVLLGDSIDHIDIEKLPHKPLDITLTDLNLKNRYSTNLTRIEHLVRYFLNNKHYIGTSDEKVFTDAIFEINGGIPQKRKDILKTQRGKMSRDTLKQIDILNVLNLV